MEIEFDEELDNYICEVSKKEDPRELLEELRKNAEELAKVGDASIAFKTDQKSFLNKWSKVEACYRFVSKKGDFPEIAEAIMILDKMKSINPSLKSYTDIIINNPFDEFESTNSENTIDTSMVSKKIEELVSSIQNMHQWDTEEIEEIEYQLNDYRELLMSNQSLFEPTIYQELMSNINAALFKIERFNKMVEETKGLI